jgi:hypothetical protein
LEWLKRICQATPPSRFWHELSYPLRANMTPRQRIELTFLPDQSNEESYRKIIGKSLFAKRKAQGVSWFGRHGPTLAALPWGLSAGLQVRRRVGE